MLAILANRDDENVHHFLSKREAKEAEDTRTTSQTPTSSEENEESFVYLAEGKIA